MPKKEKESLSSTTEATRNPAEHLYMNTSPAPLIVPTINGGSQTLYEGDVVQGPEYADISEVNKTLRNVALLDPIYFKKMREKRASRKVHPTRPVPATVPTEQG